MQIYDNENNLDLIKGLFRKMIDLQIACLGGAYSDSIKAMATGYRDWSHPSSRYFSDIGLRCVINFKGNTLNGIPTKDRLYK